MKTIKRKLKSLALATGLLLGGLLPTCAQYASPVGTWDCVISGRAQGVAYLTFNWDNTISGYEVLTPRNAGTTTNENVRGGDNIGRTTEVSNGHTTTNLAGFALVSGLWSHDATGKKILGFYTEGNYSLSCTTNTAITCTVTNEVLDLGGGIFVTNSTTVCTTNNDNVVCEIIGLTNGLSFSAIVRPGSRLSIKATSVNGEKSLKGVPATEISDLSGYYYAQGKKSGVQFTEFLLMEASEDFANAFDVEGAGAGYEFQGIALASSQKKIGFVYFGDPLISLFGSINYSSGKASLKGFDSNNQKITYKVTPQVSLD